MSEPRLTSVIISPPLPPKSSAGSAIRPEPPVESTPHAGDQIVPSHERQPDLRSAAAALAGGVGNIAKGVAANEELPQRYRLRAVEPDTARGKTTNAMIVDTTAGRVKDGKPAGNWVLRSDAPHRGASTHHVNIRPDLIGGTDPHTPISAGAYRAAGAAARLVESTEKVALPVGLAVDAARLGTAFTADGGRIGENTVQTGAAVVGGWAGAAAGSAAGAEGGAVVGSAIGACFGGVGAVPGAAIGAVAGGLAGGIGGAFGGSLAGEHLAASRR